MIEYTMEELVFKSIMSLHSSLMNDFESIIGSSNEFKSFLEVYKVIERFYSSPNLKRFFSCFQRINVTEKLEKLKSVTALYACYFAMEYCYRKENPEGEKLTFSYLKDYFDDTDTDVIRQIYKAIKRKIDALENVKELRNEKIINPCEFKKHFEDSHIYRGGIVQYLSKSCKIESVDDNKKSKKLYFYDVAPSITMIALKNIAHLPNGSYTNRSKTSLTGIFLDNIGKSLSGGSFVDSSETSLSGESSQEEIKDGVAFNKTKIKYKSSSKESSKIAEIINLMAVDDIYRQERLNNALLRYVKMSEWINCRKITERDYIRIAKLLSVYLEIPPFAENDYFDFEYAFFYALEHEDRDTANNIIFPVFSFFTITFPWIVGLTCFLLFYKNERMKELNEIKEIISGLEEIIIKDYEDLHKYFEIKKDKIWSCDNTGSQYTWRHIINKGSHDDKHHNDKIELREDHGLPLEELIELLMSVPKNIINTRNILEENGIKCPQTEAQKRFYLQTRTEQDYRFHLRAAEKANECVFHPDEYIAKIACAFVDQVFDINVPVPCSTS